MQERPHIIVFGAGASYGARTESPPPLGAELACYLLAWLTANDPGNLSPEQRFAFDNPNNDAAPPEDLWEACSEFCETGVESVHETLEDAKRRGFEVVMNELMGHHKRDLLVCLRALAARLRPSSSHRGDSRELLIRLQRMMAFSMLNGRRCAFREGEDLYDKYIECLKAHGGFQQCVFITPNYDAARPSPGTRWLARSPPWRQSRLRFADPPWHCVLEALTAMGGQKRYVGPGRDREKARKRGFAPMAEGFDELVASYKARATST